jgi:hypothetical protein
MYPFAFLADIHKIEIELFKSIIGIIDTAKKIKKKITI